MARNVEVKARCLHLEELRKRVVYLGATGPEVLIQIDTFFHVPVGRLKLREFGNDCGELIYYTRPDTSGPKVSEYQRVATSDPGQLRQILGHALGIRATIRKRREVFLLDETRIHLDDVETLGTFVEFEVVLREGQSATEGHDVALGLMRALSIPTTDLITHAYVDLVVHTP